MDRRRRSEPSTQEAELRGSPPGALNAGGRTEAVTHSQTGRLHVSVSSSLGFRLSDGKVGTVIFQPRGAWK